MNVFFSICIYYASILIIILTSNGEVHKVLSQMESGSRITLRIHIGKRDFPNWKAEIGQIHRTKLARDLNQPRMGWHIPGQIHAKGVKVEIPESRIRFSARRCSLNETPTWDEGPPELLVRDWKTSGITKKKKLRRIAYREQMADGSLSGKASYVCACCTFSSSSSFSSSFMWTYVTGVRGDRSTSDGDSVV